MTLYRLGLIHYTNVAPLLHTLEHELVGQDVSWVRDVPTGINAALLAGRVDIANISAFEFIQHAEELRALPDFSISVLGAVYSVNLFHTVPWEQLEGKRIAVTTHSATSVKLLETLLKLDGINATLERSDGVGLEELLTLYPAVLLIGDAALSEWYRVCGPISETTQMFRLPNEGHLAHGEAVTVTDLAMSWYEHTGLPFVFAVWVAQRSTPVEDALRVHARLIASRDWGIAHLPSLAAQAALATGVARFTCEAYLSGLDYRLSLPHLRGLTEFYRRLDATGRLQAQPLVFLSAA